MKLFLFFKKDVLFVFGILLHSSHDRLPEQPSGFRWGATLRHSIMRMIIIGLLIYTLQVVYNKDLPTLAKQDEEIEARIFDRNCSKDYREDRKKFKGKLPEVMQV